MRSLAHYAALLIFLLPSVARAAETETQYLSGLGKDDPVKWEFKCDKGQNADKWSTIGVPSNWELQGFGIYTYGRITPAGGWPRVHGIYKRTFTTPVVWRDKTIFVKFEGVMTDARVTINGQSAGPMHQSPSITPSAAGISGTTPASSGRFISRRSPRHLSIT